MGVEWKKMDNPYNVVTKQTKGLSMNIMSQLSLEYSKSLFIFFWLL